MSLVPSFTLTFARRSCENPTLKSNLTSPPYAWDRVSIDVRKTSRVEEVRLERYPCVP